MNRDANYNPDKHHRRSIRLKGYDYAQAGLYFITLCCQDRKHLFGIVRCGKMVQNAYGKIIAEEWGKTDEIRDNIVLHDYIIMPNHFHAIIEILFSKAKETPPAAAFKSPSHTIGAIIRGFKGATTKRIKELFLSTGESQFAPAKGKGESQFAPTEGKDESQFAPTEGKGESQFASIPKIDLSKSIWQRNYYEHIIRDHKAYENISYYIINNPMKWEADKFYRK